MDTDVLIVGGGIGGAVLALILGREGWRIRILEREGHLVELARPEILQETTLSALERLGVGPELRSVATRPIRLIDVRRSGEVLFRADEMDLAAARVAPHSEDPRVTRALILEAALATGRVELVRGAEVTDVTRSEGRVVGVRGRRAGAAFEERGRLVVGDDGVRSIIRGGIGSRIKLRLFPLEFVVFDLPRPPELAADEVRGWLDPGAMRGGMVGGFLAPFPPDRSAGLIFMPIATWEQQFVGDPRLFWKSLERLTPLADALREELEFPRDFTRLRRPYGHASTYVADGAALIGDAAHPMSPVGGQGANAAVWDALALAEVADTALRAGDLSVDRLRAYEAQRRPANTRSLWYTRRAVTLARFGRWGPGGPQLLVSIPRRANRETASRRLLLRKVATAFLDSGPEP
jgi:2-polyprenyl-6-methoxyphenol hydroxylase-like FAD-dependent oxidoreductase